MLAYLALTPTGSETRERLAGLLWSDRSEEQARASLRQCVKQLKEALEAACPGLLCADRQSLRLVKDRVDVDLAVISQRIASRELDASFGGETLRPDQILYGFEALDEAFTAWLHVVREQWAMRLTDSLQAILRSPNTAPAVRRLAAESILKMDKSHEEAQRLLIAHYASEGNIGAALRQYNELWDLLDKDFDMEPAEETQRLIAEVKSGSFAAAQTPAATPAAAPTPAPTRTATLAPYSPVIGVQRFLRSDTNGDPGYALEGFRRELIARLVRFREWIIVEGDMVGPRGAHARLAPSDYQLEGLFFESNEKVRLVITLKETTTGRYIWSESFDLESKAWFAAYQEIVRRVALALNVYLSAEILSQRISEPKITDEAYDAWLRGHELIQRWEPDAELEAESIFRKIIAQTPDFAPAYSSLAQIYNTRHIVFPGIFRSAAHELEALSFARQAVAIDPLDTRAQLCLAWSNAMRGRFDQAEIYYNLAYELNQSNPATLISCAQGWAFCGHYPRAAETAAQAEDLNPMMPAYHWGYLVGIHFLCGNYEASVRAAGLAQDRISNLPGWSAAALAHLGRQQQAEKTAAYFLDFVRQRWRSKDPCSDEEIARWFLHSFPIKEAAARSRLQEGLRKAGLPA
ncbi:MAG: trifolitoxin synthesis, TfuA [Kiloniellaceae bacterium]